MLKETHKAEIEDILSRYPVKRSALLPLLYMAQREQGYVTEAAMQERGQAGEHQVDGAYTALGHAYGGGSQFFAMWVVAGEKP